MDELMTTEERAEDDLDPPEAGSTVSLTDEGWEASDYIDPGDDWALQVDGSYLSPDGTLRSWPAAGPEPI